LFSKASKLIPKEELGFKLKPIEAELAKQRKKAVDFTSDTAKAVIEKRWTEEKMRG